MDCGVVFVSFSLIFVELPTHIFDSWTDILVGQYSRGEYSCDFSVVRHFHTLLEAAQRALCLRLDFMRFLVGVGSSASIVNLRLGRFRRARRLSGAGMAF